MYGSGGQFYRTTQLHYIRGCTHGDIMTKIQSSDSISDSAESLAYDGDAVRMIAFDFDGTITTKDTFALFIKYYAGTPRWLYTIIGLTPYFAAYGLKFIDRNAVKRHVVRRFFKGRDADELQAKAAVFARDVIPGLIRPLAQKELDAKHARGEDIYIVSASIEHYLIPWAKTQGINHVFATQLQKVENRLTGELDGPNCWGDGKTARIRAEMGQTPYIIAEAYGDSNGDKPLLYAAKASFWRPFRL